MLTQFIEYLAGIGYKATSIRAYKYAVIKCIKTWGGDYSSLAEITPDTIRGIYSTLDLCENSKKVYISYFGQFLQWATGHNPVSSTKILWNRTSTRVKFITPSDYRALLYAGNPTQRLILILGAQMGLRRAEMANIKLSDIHGHYMTVHGKGHGPEGLVCEMELPPDVYNAINEYIAWRNSEPVAHDLLLIFMDERGHRSEPKDRAQAVAYNIRLLADRYGIEATTHSLRRLYGTTLYRAGYTIDTVAAAMRHANPSTTWRYIATNQDEVSRAVQNIGELLKV